MTMRLPLALLIAALVAGCGAPAAGPLGAKLTITPAAAKPALVALPAPASRVLAEGAFTLPASLVSIGSGGLVSIGSGGLVSIGSGGLVSIGSGGYKVLAAAADVAIPGAVVTLARPYGEAVDAAYEVAPAQTGADGTYRLHGRAPAGLYRVAATAGGHTFMTLVAVTSDAPANAAVDAATTMVAAKLLAEHPAGDLSVLPMQAFSASVAAVRAAIAADGLPAGWTPARAAEAMAALERANPAVAAAMKGLRAQHAGLQSREDALAYRLQELAASLGVPPQVVEEELQAALSAAPEASDAEIDAEVTAAVQRRSAGAEASTPAPSAPAADATPAPAVPTAAPADEPAAAPPEEAPTAAPAEGATEDDAEIERAMAKEERKAKAKHQPTPTASPSTAPTEEGEDDAAGETPDDDATTPPTGEETGGEGEGADPGDEPGTGGEAGNGNGNAGGNGNGNANAGGNGNANGQNGTQGQGNGGTNNGNGGATNGTGTN